MIKERKLVIIHYYGDDIKKIGKSPTGFPLQVQVRYKKLKTVFSSRLGLRYANLNVLGEQKIRDYFQISSMGLGYEDSTEFTKKIIQDEISYIQNFRIYFENQLGIEFNPSYLCSIDFDNWFLESITDYVSNMIDSEFKNLEFQDNDMGQFFTKLQNTNTMNVLTVLRVLETVNFDFFNYLINFGELRFFYSIFQILTDELNLDRNGVTLLEFRLIDFSENLRLKQFKLFFDNLFDHKVSEILGNINLQ
jgi:hypothetical protein